MSFQKFNLNPTPPSPPFLPQRNIEQCPQVHFWWLRAKKNRSYIETYIYFARLLQEHIDIFSFGLVDTWTEKSLLFMINHELTDLLIIKITCCLAANDEQREATTTLSHLAQTICSLMAQQSLGKYKHWKSMKYD